MDLVCSSKGEDVSSEEGSTTIEMQNAIALSLQKKHVSG